MAKKVVIGILIALLIIIAVPIILIYVLGSTGTINEGIPEIGIDVINMPFSAEGQQTVPAQWLVHGNPADQYTITTVYFSKLPSQADFTTSTTPESAGYTLSAPAQEIILPDGQKVFQADVPNAFEVIYVRIYALINNQHYWSKEYILESS